ncbi:hypothetical protein [Rathayibacter sp. VKM Ac-2927]|uniref:hypothetical protein n=1 Tax=Rathayibacter sp. VKM Ac-2927 TaxID=2929478 RepID=UPI001FB47F91|nr:hypothetical protein [Rathayibacter sp. VKM Ac-2927]MCJ1688473.1 hypothetical protein [Rathayibacter sp. VKM Ac-2927]
MALDPTSRALTDLIAALAEPGAIHTGLAQHISDLAADVLHHHEHRVRFPTLGFPFAAVNGVSTSPDESPTANL